MPQVVTGKRGEITEPQLHDAYLTAVMNEKTDVILRFWKRGAVCEVMLRDVGAMCIDEYSEQNAVNDLLVLPITSLTPAEARRMCHLGPNEREAVAVVQKLSALPLLLVVLEPACGANLLASCKAVDYRIVTAETREPISDGNAGPG